MEKKHESLRIPFDFHGVFCLVSYPCASVDPDTPPNKKRFHPLVPLLRSLCYAFADDFPFDNRMHAIGVVGHCGFADRCYNFMAGCGTFFRRMRKLSCGLCCGTFSCEGRILVFLKDSDGRYFKGFKTFKAVQP